VDFVAEDDEHSKDNKTSDLNLREQEHCEAFVDPLVVNALEDSFATSEFCHAVRWLRLPKF
jgi:hypothetical protein